MAKIDSLSELHMFGVCEERYHKSKKTNDSVEWVEVERPVTVVRAGQPISPPSLFLGLAGKGSELYNPFPVCCIYMSDPLTMESAA